MNLRRAALLVMGAGLLLIGQPFAHALFAAGFALALAGLLAYAVLGLLGRGEEA